MKFNGWVRNGSKHPLSKLTEEAVREIRRTTTREERVAIAARLGVSITAVTRAYERQSWRHVE